jgi:hypothetical protein
MICTIYLMIVTGILSNPTEAIATCMAQAYR